jgi:hypothetical protein
MDGVLADMHTALAAEAERLFAAEQDSAVIALEDAVDEESVVCADSRAAGLPGPSRRYLTSRQGQQLWRHVAGITDFWKGLNEIEPGAVARLATLAREGGWEVIFLTQRPATEGATVQQQTQQWLRHYGYDLPSVCTTQGSRGRIAAALALDAVVDDRVEGCCDVAADSSARPILVWREPYNPPVRRSRRPISVVRCVNECLDLLANTSAAVTPAPPVVGRLKSFFGFPPYK